MNLDFSARMARGAGRAMPKEYWKEGSMIRDNGEGNGTIAVKEFIS